MADPAVLMLTAAVVAVGLIAICAAFAIVLLLAIDLLLDDPPPGGDGTCPACQGNEGPHDPGCGHE